MEEKPGSWGGVEHWGLISLPAFPAQQQGRFQACPEPRDGEISHSGLISCPFTHFIGLSKCTGSFPLPFLNVIQNDTGKDLRFNCFQLNGQNTSFAEMCTPSVYSILDQPSCMPQNLILADCYYSKNKVSSALQSLVLLH